MNDSESSAIAEEKYRVLRKHPQDTSRISEDVHRCERTNTGLDCAQQEAFESIWTQLNRSGDQFSALSDLNSEVFEKIRIFCQTAVSTEDIRVPVGALFTGSLVQCNEVDPLELLIEVLSSSSFTVTLLKSPYQMDDCCLSTLLEDLVEKSEETKKGMEDYRPILVVDSLEATDSVWFADLLALLIRNRSLLRVTLLVGLSTTTRIDTFVPSVFRSRIRSRPFALMSPRQCFERTLELTLLSPVCPGIIVGKKVFEILNNQFLYFHFTVKSFKDSVQMALLDHLSTEPNAVLLQFMNPGFMTNKRKLMSALKKLKSEIWFTNGVQDMAKLLQESMDQISGWKGTLLCIHCVTEMLGLITRGSGYTIRELYLSSLESHFPKSLPKLTEWCNKMTHSSECVEKLNELINQLGSVLEGFGQVNMKMKRVAAELRGFSNRLGESSNTEKPVSSVATEVDQILNKLVQEYCLVSPESLSGASIFCLRNDELVKRRLLAAPRMEIPDLLMDEELRQK
eukprot:g6351.t1